MEEIFTPEIILFLLGFLFSIALFVLIGYLWNYYVIKELRNLDETNDSVKKELQELNVHLGNIEKILKYSVTNNVGNNAGNNAGNESQVYPKE